ncbi:MAG: peptidoglycan-binding protein [Oscillospiraceae bacterium]
MINNNCRCPCPPPCPPPTANGLIRVRSATGEDAVPVPNVDIRISPVGNTSGSSIVFNTGENGLSNDIQVQCPSRALSLDENNTTVLPYAVYNLSAVAQGYGTIYIEGIQVFAGEVAMVELAMIPALDPLSSISDETFVVPEHSLFTGTGGSGPGPIEACKIPRVLSQAVIPDRITVHLGKPTASAQNVTVSFRDYIKNVASSEVYPTWPEEALRANIHAQISLAVNRVYTEWYKSKGYPFQITSSTSYDQKYVHGRNIFEVMSRITDDIFNTYVRKTGTENPFYTEYCDGKQVTCAGMKQWGTVTQAQNGKNALQILQYYYGNIEIVRTDNIAAIPESYPGNALRQGDTGPNVSIIQRWLNRVAKDYPFFGTLTVNGVFGAETTAVVKKFQKQFSLEQDGIVGRSTWYKISYIYVAVKKLAELTSEGEKPNGLPVSGVYPGTPLRIGSRGTSVEQIQFWLNGIGKFVSSIPSVAVDGIFGAGTSSAVRAFQTHFKLTVDGIVGANTWNAIYNEYKSVEMDTTPPPINRPGQYPGAPLRVGSRGDDVMRMQFYLRIISRFNSAIPSITADGIFGAATSSAVRAFQSFYGLAADGVVGLLTWNKIYEVYTSLTNELLAPSDRPGTYPGTPLRQGDSGRAVKELQYYLFLLSAYYASIPVIAVDGRFGPATTQAVKAFQRLRNLTVDGIVGRATWAAIYAQIQKFFNIDGPVYAYEPIEYAGQPIGSGSGGDSVLFIQYLLQYIGFFSDMILPCEQTGNYDAQTELSVKSFQKIAGLAETGIVDNTTWDYLVTAWLQLASETDRTKGVKSDTQFPGYVLLLGSAGLDVEELQAYINGIAARYCVGDFVPENGIYDLATEAAVAKLQEGFGLEVRGVTNRETWDAIYAFYIKS